MAERTIGAYELLEPLGQGGMGTVYRVRHMPTGTIRALKLLRRSTEARLRARFEREGEALARLNGQGVVPIHETGSSGGCPYFVMALMPGGSLAARIKREGRLPWRDAATMVAALARTLARAHALDLVHRDIKPDNILFDDEGRPYLADFGCVRDLNAPALTVTGGFVGTFAYMAPEQIEGRRADHRCDIFALGAVLEEASTGSWRRLSVPGSRGFLTASGLSATEAEGAPVELREIVERALAESPDDRFETAEQLALALETLLSVDATATARDRAHRLLARAVFGGGALILAAGAALVLTHRTAPQAPKASLAEAVRAFTVVARARASAPDSVLAARVATALLVASKDLGSDELAADVYGAEAECELAWGDDATARDLATRALDLGVRDPKTARALLLVRARARLRLGESDPALEDLKRLDMPEARRLRFDVLMKLGRFAEAAAVEGDDPTTVSLRAWARYRVDGDRERAERELRRLGDAGVECLAAIQELDARTDLESATKDFKTKFDIPITASLVFARVSGDVSRLDGIWQNVHRRCLDPAATLGTLEHVLRVVALDPPNFAPPNETNHNASVCMLARALDSVALGIAGSHEAAAAPHSILTAWILSRVTEPSPQPADLARDRARLAGLARWSGRFEKGVDLYLQEALLAKLEPEVLARNASVESYLERVDAAASVREIYEDGRADDPRPRYEALAAELCSRLADEAPDGAAREALLARAERSIAHARATAKAESDVRPTFKAELLLAFVRHQDARAEATLPHVDPFLNSRDNLIVSELKRRQGQYDGARAFLARARQLSKQELTTLSSAWHRLDCDLAQALLDLADPKEAPRRSEHLAHLRSLAATIDMSPRPFGWIVRDVKAALAR